MNIGYPNVLALIDGLIQITPKEQHEVHKNFYYSLIEIIKNHHKKAKALGSRDFQIGYVEQSIFTILSGSIIATYEDETSIRRLMSSTEELMNMSINAARIDYSYLKTGEIN